MPETWLQYNTSINSCNTLHYNYAEYTYIPNKTKARQRHGKKENTNDQYIIIMGGRKREREREGEMRETVKRLYYIREHQLYIILRLIE
jgi:hypothetical protein